MSNMQFMQTMQNKFLLLIFVLFLFFVLVACTSTNLDSEFNETGEILSFANVGDYVSDLNNSYVSDAYLASKESCEVFDLINRTLSETTIKNNTVFLDGEVLTHEKLIGIISLFYRQHDFLVPKYKGVMVMAGLQSYHFEKSGSGPIAANSFILIDTFVQHKNGFWADIARTFVIGDLDEQEEKQFFAVKDALFLAEELFVKDALANEAAQKLIQFFDDKSFFSDKKSGVRHMLGHGVSKDEHSRPWISTASSDILEENSILTTELALYYEDTGGVRLENTGLVSDGGFLSFCDFPLENFIVK